jgi:hypothetical protein
VLGERVSLKGWTGYRAGLDVNSTPWVPPRGSGWAAGGRLTVRRVCVCGGGTDGQTGTHSVFTQFRDLDIMFHVSTLLPYSDSNMQQAPPTPAQPGPRGRQAPDRSFGPRGVGADAHSSSASGTLATTLRSSSSRTASPRRSHPPTYAPTLTVRGMCTALHSRVRERERRRRFGG